MAPLSTLQLAVLLVPNLLARLSVGASAIDPQIVLQPSDPGNGHVLTPAATEIATKNANAHRRLHGKFLHITDLHPDEHYKPHTSTDENIACHRQHGVAGVYGAETSDCDSPMALVNATLAWVKEHLRDEIDFVVWTGDSARHDSDEKIPRQNEDILTMNRRISDAFAETFSDDVGLVIPVVPTFGNNDIYPHNILMPGPNDILRTYKNIWRPFIPEAQRNSFEFGGWFYVEVIPNQLAVFSLNTMYFFERNAGMDDCVHPAEPGYKHFEWLRVQLNYLRSRGMKAILMGHVPPARTSGKQLWDETCWQKYTLWLQQYRDVVISSLYGHMNIDHFFLQDTNDIDMGLIDGSKKEADLFRETLREEDFGIQSRADYLRSLCDDWAKLPSPVALEETDAAWKNKGKKRKKNKFGGKWAERYQLTFISPSIVPNYFPSLRVFEYNITGLEETPTWVDVERSGDFKDEYCEEEMPVETPDETLTETPDETLEETPEYETPEVGELKRRQDPALEALKKKKKPGKGHKTPDLHIPEPPAKGSLPGPAYRPQTLTLLGYTQYYANLTEINNDITSDSHEMSWKPGKHTGKTPKYSKPQPREFHFEVEYSTFDDKVYQLEDLTVKNLVKLAYRIGQVSTKSVSSLLPDFDFGDDVMDGEEEEEDFEVDPGEEEVDEIDVLDEEEEDTGVDSLGKSGGKKKGKKGKKRKGRQEWLHFLKHAFVSTKTRDELKKYL